MAQLLKNKYKMSIFISPKNTVISNLHSYMKPNLRPICLLFFLLAWLPYSIGQSQYLKNISIHNQAFKLKTNPDNNRFTLHAEKDDAIVSNQVLLKEIHQFFKLSSDCQLTVSKEKLDKYGNTHTFYTQYHKGVPVDGSILIIHKKTEKVTSVNGELAPGLQINQQPVLGEPAALNAGISLWENQQPSSINKSKLNSKSNNTQLVIATKDPTKGLASDNMVLAYKTKVTTSNYLLDETLIIDANNGGLVYNYSNIAQCSPTTMDTPFYGSQSTDIETNGSVYELLDSCRNIKAFYSGNPNTSISSSQSDFSDIDQHIRQVFWGIQSSWDYMGNYHGIFGPGNNYDLVRIRYSPLITCNASANANEVIFHYNFDNPCGEALTGLDVCGHEYSHNILYKLVGLNYLNEGKPIHEGIADIVGALVENANFPGSGVWTLGENSIPPYYPYLRSLTAPKSGFFKVSDTYNGQYYANDYQGSGVISHAFYLLSEGSDGTDQINDNQFEYCVTGIGIQKASDILFQALQYYFSSTTDFLAVRSAFLNAVVDIYGTGSDELRSVVDAFDAVGVGGGLIPITPVEFSLTPGNYGIDDTLFLTSDYPIYYTLDGSSVISESNTISTSAILYNGPILFSNVPDTLTVVAKAILNGEWSSSCPVSYIICKPGAPDSDNDGVCDDADKCPSFDDGLVGTPCNDSLDCTINDIWTNNCTCEGTWADADNDGFCDFIDICPGSPLNQDLDNDGFCDPVVCVVNDENDFESSIGNWIPADPAYAYIATSNTYANSGTHYLRLYWDDTVRSKIFTAPIDLSSKNEASIELFYRSVNYGLGDDFSVYLSNDNGANYTLVKAYRFGIEIPTNGKYFYDKLFTAGPFTTDVIFKIEGNGKGYIFLDDLRVKSCVNCPINDSTCNAAPIALNDTYVIDEDILLVDNVNNNDVEPDSQAVNIYPLSTTLHGTLQLAGDGNFTYEPDPNFNGSDSFVYETCDDSPIPNCSVAEVVITINSVNDAPIATNKCFDTDFKVTLTGDASQNDYDVEGDDLSFLPVTYPISGQLIWNLNGDFFYIPDTTFSGTVSFTYEVCDDQTPKLCDTATICLNVRPDCINFDLQVYLEGCFNLQTLEMRTYLNTIHQLLPGMTNNPGMTGQPYNRPPWNYAGTEGINQTTYPFDIVDWVMVSLRESPDVNTEVFRVAGLLDKDGFIDLSEGCLPPQNLQSEYYVVIEHRNHMTIMSAQPVPIVNKSLTMDFRQQNGYAVLSFSQKEVVPGTWVMVTGDSDKTSNSYYDDINGQDRVLWLDDNGEFKVYKNTDFNMDSDVNGSDIILWQINNGLFSNVPK